MLHFLIMHLENLIKSTILYFLMSIEVISAYGVTFDNFAIDGYTVAQRSVFCVEADGTIGYAWYADNPGIEPIILLYLHILVAEINSHAFKWNARDGLMTIALVASDVCLQDPFGVMQRLLRSGGVIP